MSDGSGKKGSRHRAYRLGHRAEELAAWLLRIKGYRILGRRVKTPRGEIDLIVRRGPVVAFVEVKARGDLDRAKEAVSLHQRQRIVEAAELWLAGRPDMARLDRRFDLVLLAPGHLPRHFPNAWFV